MQLNYVLPVKTKDNLLNRPSRNTILIGDSSMRVPDAIEHPYFFNFFRGKFGAMIIGPRGPIKTMREVLPSLFHHILSVFGLSAQPEIVRVHIAKGWRNIIFMKHEEIVWNYSGASPFPVCQRPRYPMGIVTPASNLETTTPIREFGSFPSPYGIRPLFNFSPEISLVPFGQFWNWKRSVIHNTVMGFVSAVSVLNTSLRHANSYCLFSTLKPVLLVMCVFLSGCGGLPSIKLPNLTVKGPKEAGSPAVASTSEAGTTLPIPQGSRLVKREIKGLGYRPASKGQPAREETPDETVTEIILAGPSLLTQKENTTRASTGTVDTSVAKKKIEAEESRPLLYGAIACALAAGFFVWASYPTPAIACGVGSVVLFLAWKLSDLPPWFYVIGLLAAAAGVAIYFGHKRGLYEPVPDK